MRISRRWLVLAGLLFLLGRPLSVLAAAPKGISISPFEQALDIQPGDAARSFNLTLTNHTAIPQALQLSTHDFGSLNSSGGIVLDDNSGYARRYGLVSWLSLGAQAVSVPAGQSRTVPVTVYNRANLQPGGHYGAIMASVGTQRTTSGSNRVAINQQLLSLILVDKVGGEHYNLALNGVTQNGTWLHLPNTVRLHFRNPGNVHVVPRGVARLLSPRGTVVAQGIVNDGSAFILPDSSRDFYVSLTPVAKASRWPGLYRLQVQYRYDGISRYAVKNYAVKYIDLGLYIAAGAIVLGGVLIGLKYRARLSQILPLRTSR